MKIGFYLRLAADGIRKNRRMYLPYILTCSGMVMMTYIINFLRYTDIIDEMKGGGIVRQIMEIGVSCLVFFAALFLFYTNSFLMRRRKKEFGLYHILGMGKGNLGRIIICESVYVAAISLACGLTVGIAVSKLAELGLVNMIDGEITYTLSVSGQSVASTVTAFGGIFFLLLLHSLRQVWFSGAISLLRSENVGEKPPRANWLLGILGVLILGAAYYLAVTIRDPISALGIFMVAVIMVILATYLILIAGSVLFCRILQKRKGYYYKPDHFVSVSSMVYRMKRNGAGLASICILATMVLVMISSTSALFIGGEGALRGRYPREIDLWFHMHGNEGMTDEEQQLFEGMTEEILRKHKTAAENVMKYTSVSTAGLLNGGTVIFDTNEVNNFTIGKFSDVHQFYLVPIEDYNYMMGTNETLADDEVLIYAPRNTFQGDTFGFVGLKTYRVKKILKDGFVCSDIAVDIVPSIMVIVPDVTEAAKGIARADGTDLTYKKWYYCFDTPLGGEENIAMYGEIKAAFQDLQVNDDTFKYSVESRDNERQEFYSLYGGLFYLGILLSVVFILAAVLIIYYKQVSEGYEDQARFEIMQKVGMTKRDIRRSIRSQLRTVFFLPLGFAGLHIVFAFPIIEKLLLLFQISNRPLFICTTLGSFLVFALAYTLVYCATSNAYYHIVTWQTSDESRR